MSLKGIGVRILFCFLLVTGLSQAASAYCDLLIYSGGGHSSHEALSKANAKGLSEVRQLNSQYGTHVTYDKATWKCSSGNPVTCTITQRYCVAGLDPSTATHDCGPNAVWLGGLCVDKYAPANQVTIRAGCPANLDKVCTQTPSGKLIHCHCQS